MREGEGAAHGWGGDVSGGRGRAAMGRLGREWEGSAGAHAREGEAWAGSGPVKGGFLFLFFFFFFYFLFLFSISISFISFSFEQINS
jgi:hypothetical protein